MKRFLGWVVCWKPSTYNPLNISIMWTLTNFYRNRLTNHNLSSRIKEEIITNINFGLSHGRFPPTARTQWASWSHPTFPPSVQLAITVVVDLNGKNKLGWGNDQEFEMTSQSSSKNSDNVLKVKVLLRFDYYTFLSFVISLLLNVYLSSDACSHFLIVLYKNTPIHAYIHL